MTTSEKISVYKIVTDEIIKKLDAGVVPWQQTWTGGVPQNLVSRRPYEGINAVMLALSEYSSPYWLTMKQCNDLGGKIRKGEKSTIVCFWKKLESAKKKEEKKDEEGKSFFVLRYYRVFNVAQCEGIDVPGEVTQPIGKLEACEAIVDGYDESPPIEWNAGRASYNPKEDKVYMPNRDTFKDAENAYAVLFHELAHSTGAACRLNREGVTGEIRFGSPTYSNEELIAEFASAFLCGITGIAPAIMDNSASYIASWKRRLQEDSKLLIHAAAKAQKAANYIQGISPKSHD